MHLEKLNSKLPDAGFLIRRAWHLRWTNLDASIALAEAALEHCADRPRETAIEAAEAHLVLAWNTKWRGQFDRARELCDAAEAGFRRAGDGRWLPLIHSLISIVEFDSGEYGKCEAALERARAAIGPDVAQEAMVDVLCASGALARLKGDFDDTHDLLAMADSHGHSQGAETARVAHNMARCLAAEGHAAESIAHGLKSVTAAHMARNYAVLPYVYEILAVMHVELRAYDRAASNIADGLHYAERNGDTRALIQLDIARALLESRVGDSARARRMLRSSIEDAGSHSFGWHADNAERTLQGIAGDRVR